MIPPGINRLIGVVALVLVTGVSTQARAPELQLERLDGEYQAMSDYIGNDRWVVINVWSPTCSSCVEELPDVIRFHEQHPDITVLGVTIDFPSFKYGKPEIIRDFLEEHRVPYPLFLADRELASELIGRELIAIPLIAIFHPDGHPVARWPGRIEPAEIEEFITHYESYKLDGELGDF